MLQQLLYYSKSLCVPDLFEPAQDSIDILFNPIIESATYPSQTPIDLSFVRCYAYMFMHASAEQQRSHAQDFLK